METTYHDFYNRVFSINASVGQPVLFFRDIQYNVSESIAEHEGIILLCENFFQSHLYDVRVMVKIFEDIA